ncbi:hypothetical protein EGW08_016819 [Elysia chlorotica]|uniref:Uncharacterized protein n=1 Tax=Elysia chlorotica TaxID=188477 RepID=A0A433T1H6_ELYCH|nr:hypothetical protein EGW08_016819 [Elysia chlorotica]
MVAVANTEEDVDIESKAVEAAGFEFDCNVTDSVSVETMAGAEAVETAARIGEAAAAGDATGRGVTAGVPFLPNSRLLGVPEGDPLARRASFSAIVFRCSFIREFIMLSIRARFLVLGVRPVPPRDEKKCQNIYCWSENN